MLDLPLCPLRDVQGDEPDRKGHALHGDAIGEAQRAHCLLPVESESSLLEGLSIDRLIEGCRVRIHCRPAVTVVQQSAVTIVLLEVPRLVQRARANHLALVATGLFLL